MKLGKLKKVNLRDIWKNEASDFTTWLAKDENLDLLSQEINIDLELIETEYSIGNLSVDILAQEEQTGRKVVIENQLERTDHSHLGQIITYASGVDAEIIIWIVKDVRDEHKQAIEWLNENTNQKFNFFVIRMEVWQIGNSALAPKFHIISQPNNWSKQIKSSSTQSKELTNTNLLQGEFWEKFKDYCQEKGSDIASQKASPRHWYDIKLGISGVCISLTINSKDKRLACRIYIANDKELYYALENQKEQIESELGQELTWQPLEKKKASKIMLSYSADYFNKKNWNECFAWFLETAKKFQKVFKKHIAQIKK